ncbi:MAG: GNAT family N-acetyltransferase [Pseudomonadota bacterium]
MSRYEIFAEPVSEHSEISGKIEDNLLSALSTINEQSLNSTIVLSARGSDGKFVGGVSGSTSYGWFLVKLLWVHSSMRETGIGTSLMLASEAQAKTFGCHHAWLDTSNAQAHKFYQRLGYSIFGMLNNEGNNEPVEHKRWFMKKEL